MTAKDNSISTDSDAHNQGKAPEYRLRRTLGLTPSPQNARTHSPEQIEKIKASIQAFGFLNPIIITADGIVIAGHGRLAAAKALGIDMVPTIRADHLTNTQRRAFMLADNRIADDAGYDEEILSKELRDLFLQEFDLGLTGFDKDELAEFLNPHADLTNEDEAPEPPAVPKAQLGETWLLGAHRVRCGDSTNAEDVAALLGTVKPHLMVTDPPYGVNYDPDWRNHAVRANGSTIAGRAIGKVMNDHRADWCEAYALFPGDVAYVWHPAGARQVEFFHSLEASGFEIRMQIIWNKSNFAIGRGDYHVKHEPCWYAVRKGATGHWNGSRKESTVWDIDKPQNSETGHSTQKPVECMRRPIVNNSKAGDVVYDPFLGSGTTIIGAEKESRICFGLELNPIYIDVIINRWQNFTGKKATRESDGVLFDNIRVVDMVVTATVAV